MLMLSRCADWFCRDRRTGHIVIGQWPNVPLWIFLAASLVEHVALLGSPLRGWAGWIAMAALAWWAADEVLRGVNPWRRCLGAGVLAWTVVSRLA